MSKNKAKITIFGSTYFLVTNQTEDHLYQAAAYLLLEQEQNYAMLEQKRLMEKMNSIV